MKLNEINNQNFDNIKRINNWDEYYDIFELGEDDLMSFEEFKSHVGIISKDFVDEYESEYDISGEEITSESTNDFIFVYPGCAFSYINGKFELPTTSVGPTNTSPSLDVAAEWAYDFYKSEGYLGDDDDEEDDFYE